MKQSYLLLLFLLVTPNAYVLANQYDDLTLPVYSRVYDAKRNPFEDGRQALELARQNNRRVIIELGGDWCRWCHVLERFLNQHVALKQTFFKHFVLLKVNVSEDNDNNEFLRAFPKPLGYPHMYITEANGDIIHSQDTAEFLDNGAYSEQKLFQFIERWKP